MPRTRSSRLLLLAAAALLAAGCSPNVDFPKGGQLLCQSNDDCPGESVCQVALGQCVPKDALGAAPPALAGPASVSPTYGNTATTFTISFDVTQKLLRPPELWAELRDQKLALALDEGASSGEHYVFHYQPAAADPEGVASLFVKLVDEAGNVADGLTVGTLVVDKTPPGVVFPRVEYRTTETNALGAAATAATVGTTLRVQVTANEPLDPASDPKLTATNGVDTLTFETTQVTEDGAEFEVTVPAGASDSPAVYVPSLSGWRDAAGNVSTASSFSDPEIRLKLTPPVLSVDQEQVEYLRSPWGNAETETLGSGFEIPAGPYFALAPPDPLGAATTLPAGTFRLADGTPPARVQIWADDRSESLLGMMAANPDGSWPRLRLSSLDLSAVYATGLDAAGNPSMPVKLAHAEWVATLRAPALGLSPHLLRGLGATTEALDPEPARAPLRTEAASGGLDESSLLQRGEVTWREVSVTSGGPAPRQAPALAYDPASGAVYLFGGEVGGVRSDELWRWEGGRWTQVPKRSPWPPGRYLAGMAFDAGRNRLLLFGGSPSGVGSLDDLWEWDGESWTEVPHGGAWPAPRYAAGVVYDSRRDRLVVYGGNMGGVSDPSVWEWDGTSWQERPSAEPAPSPRSVASLAYDPRRGQVLLFGGIDSASACGAVVCADTWAWDGAAWTQLTPATAPSGRAAAMITYDPLRDRVVLFGGNDGGNSLQDVWEWDGANWTDQTPAAGVQPSGRYFGGLVFDSSSGRTVLFGDELEGDPDTWEWDGASWTRRPSPSPGNPQPVASAAVAYDSTRARTVLFGGVDADGVRLDALWEHDGTRWINRTPTPRPASWPTARFGSMMVHDPIRQRDVLFGGIPGTGSVAQVWEWDGTSWLDKTPPVIETQPVGTSDDPMVFDGAQAVLFSSSESGTGATTTEVWSWNGTSWTSRWQYQTGPHPSARDGAAAAYDPTRGVAVFYGGRGPSASLGDVWEWDGTAWTERTPAGATPPTREFGSMAFDPNRNQVVLFGGKHVDASGAHKLQDLWAWDGTAWTELTPRALKPEARDDPRMVFSDTLQTLMVVGGLSAEETTLGDTWTLEEGVGRTPGVQFTVHGAASQLGPVTGLRVRARCGGTAFLPTASDGATLLGWTTGIGTTLPVGWTALDTNAAAAGADAPYLPGEVDALLDWTAASQAEAQRYVLPQHQLEFQCRALGASEAGGQEARLAMDYIEARVQYLTQ